MEKAVDRSKRKKTVRLPIAFVRDQKSATPDPPIAKIFRGGGELRLRVYLTTVMMATRAPHRTTVASADMAALLNLSDPGGAGAARVSRAYRQLGKMKLVQRDPLPGRVLSTVVLDPAGTGQGWNAADLERPWLTLPIDLWRRGWLVALSGSSLVVLALLRELTGGRRDNSGWADGVRKDQYGVSRDTWTRGTRELVAAGLLDVNTRVYSSHGEPRRRNVYTLHSDRLMMFDPGGSLSAPGP